MARYGEFKNTQRLRMMAIRKLRKNPQGENVIDHAGWHYSYLYGNNPEKIRLKMMSIFDGKANEELIGTTEQIAQRIDNKQDIWGRRSNRYHQTIVDITNNKPKHLDEWLKVYPEYFYARN